MSNILKVDDIKTVFVYDDEEIIELRQKQFNEIINKTYPKLGKIKLENFSFDKFNLKQEEVKMTSNIDDELKQLIDDENNIIILKDGNIIYKNLDNSFKDVVIDSYYTAINNKNAAFEIFKTSLTTLTDDKFITINKAFRNSYLYIYVPKNIVVKETLKIYIVGSTDLVHYTYLYVDKNSELSIMEKLTSINNINVNIISKVEVSNNAKVNYVGLDRFNKETKAYIMRQADVYQDGSIIYALGQLNDGNTVSYNDIKLLGNNAYAESRNVFLTDSNSTHAATVNIEHFAPYSQGTITNHGIVKDKAYLHIDGIGKIHQGMHHSNSQQHSKVIILSDEAKVDANPYLLIDEYDVFAGHGAGVGKVDEEQLYYLMSRGLTRQTAEKLIILGFLFPIVELIKSDSLKASFIKTIEHKLSI